MTRKPACDSCHRKKISCNRQVPRCEWCIHRGLHCTYTRAAIQKTRVKNSTWTLEDEVERRIERLESLVGPKLRQMRGVQAAQQLRHSSIAREGVSYGRLGLAASDLGNISSQGGVPIFSKKGLQWIRERTSDPRAFEAVYSQTASSFPLSSTQSALQLPPRAAVEHCLDTFSLSPIRLVWPVVNTRTFCGTVELAFACLDPQLPKVRVARVCTLAFVAFMSVIEPAGVSVGSFDPRECAKQALNMLLLALEQPSVEGLQATVTLCLYYDFSGQIGLAYMLHSLACRCLYMLGGHLEAVAEEGLATTHGKGQSGEFLRGLFWLCYFSDKHLSLRTGQPPCIDDDQCNIVLPRSFTGLGSLSVSMSEGPLRGEFPPVFPGDLSLTIIKSKVYRKLYCPHSETKDDAHLLRDIRELDDELEGWRMSVPEAIRPSISVAQQVQAIIAKHPLGMKVIFAHFEYLYLISAIHRACARCRAWADGEGGETRAVSSSWTLSVQASRSTLVYLQTASMLTHSESFWLIVFYPVWAALTLFLNTLLCPVDEQTHADIELLEYVPALFKTMRNRQLSAKEELHLRSFDVFIGEIVRHARCAGDREMDGPG